MVNLKRWGQYRATDKVVANLINFNHVGFHNIMMHKLEVDMTNPALVSNKNSGRVSYQCSTFFFRPVKKLSITVTCIWSAHVVGAWLYFMSL